MVRFIPNRPIATDGPTIVVDGRLDPGEYRFRLVVVDDEGNESNPDEQVVVVRPARVPPIDDR